MAKRGGFWGAAERVAGNLGRVFGALRGVSLPPASVASVWAEDDEREEGEEMLTPVAAVAHVPTVYGCVDLIKTTVAKFPLRFYLGEPGGDREEIEAEKGNVVSLFRSPNPTDSGFSFVEKICASLDLAGNAYILLEKVGAMIVRMYVLPAHLIEVKTGPNFSAASYALHYGGKITRFLPDQILHLRYWSPTPGPLGMAPMSPASLSYRTQRLAQRWTHSIYLRGGEASGVYKSERPVGTAKRERLELKQKQRHRGPENAGRMLILPPGVERVQTMLTPEQMKLLETYGMMKKDIYEVFGVPPWMKGLKEGSSLGSSGAEVDERMFIDNTIEPRCSRIAGGVTYLLLRYIDPTLHCEFDLSSAFTRRQHQIEMLKSAKEALGVPIASVNEYRTRLMGWDPLPGEEFDKPPAQPVPGATGGGEPGAGGDPEAGKDTKTDDAEKGIRRRGSLREITPADRARIDAALAAHERRVHTAWLRIFAGQEARVGSALERSERSEGARQDIPDADLVGALELTVEERAMLVRLFEFILETQGEAALVALGVKLEFSMNRAGAAEFIRKHIDRALTHVNETTRDALRLKLAEVVAGGGGLADAAKAVHETFDHRRDNALTIARTETAPAFNFATWSAWVQSEVVGSKTWVTIMDGHARDGHEEADGQTVALVEKFRVRGTLEDTFDSLIYPGDPEGAAGNVINCRCGMLAVLMEEGRSAPLAHWLGRALPGLNGHGKPTNRLKGFLANGTRS